MATAERSYLLDTHTFLWMTSAPGQLGPETLELVEQPRSQLLLSVASVWEIAIKASLGKLSVPRPLHRYLDDQLSATRTRLLDIRAEHALRVESLDWHHRDPFDRLLVAQAIVEKLPLLSRDQALDPYPVERIW